MATFVSMATCHACSKTSRQVGVNRDFLFSKTYSTPVSKNRTPQSANRPTPKSGLHDKTPVRTPVPRSAEPSSASKSASGKKSAFSRLKKILMLEDSQKSKKGGLKDFLTSL